MWDVMIHSVHECLGCELPAVFVNVPQHRQVPFFGRHFSWKLKDTTPLHLVPVLHQKHHRLDITTPRDSLDYLAVRVAFLGPIHLDEPRQNVEVVLGVVPLG